MEVESSYDGPHLGDEITREFIDQMIEHFKIQKKIHRKYAFKVCASFPHSILKECGCESYRRTSIFRFWSRSVNGSWLSRLSSISPFQMVSKGVQKIYTLLFLHALSLYLIDERSLRNEECMKLWARSAIDLFERLGLIVLMQQQSINEWMNGILRTNCVSDFWMNHIASKS